LFLKYELNSLREGNVAIPHRRLRSCAAISIQGGQIKVGICLALKGTYHATASDVSGNNETNWETVVGQQWLAIHGPADHHLLVLVLCTANLLGGSVWSLGQLVDTLKDNILGLATISAGCWLDVFKNVGEVDSSEESSANDSGTPVESQTLSDDVLLFSAI
jgi:hypothetical protein